MPGIQGSLLPLLGHDRSERQGLPFHRGEASVPSLSHRGLADSTPGSKRTAVTLPKPRRCGRLKQAAAVLATTLALTGGALALAPTALAVGSSGCSSSTFNWSGHIQRANLVNLRSGSGTSYSSCGLVSDGTRLKFICYRSPKTAGGTYWAYVKITSGPQSGTYGWVDRHYMYAA